MNNTILCNPHLEGDSFFWESGPTGILLIHGYTATTAEVRLLARFFHERGYTVAGPLLPGHRTTPEDMNLCRWQDWTGTVEAAYRQIAACCERVFVGGESMGAVLSLYLASEHPEVIGILLYAPALLVPPRSMIMARLLSPFMPYLEKQPGPPSAADERWQGYTVRPLRAAVQLNRLQHEVRHRLPRIRQPILAVQGRLDKTIDPRSGQVILRETTSIVKEMHWLEHSSHRVILDQEWEQAAELTLRFIERVLA